MNHTNTIYLASQANIFIFIAEFIIWITTAILTVYHKNHHLIIARSITPYGVIFFYGIQLMSSINTYLLSSMYRRKYSCLFRVFGIQVGELYTDYTFILFCFQFLILSNLTRFKVDFHKNKIILIILKILVKPVFLVSIMTMCLGGYFTYAVINFSSINWTCDRYSEIRPSLGIAINLAVGSIGVPALILLLVEVIRNVISFIKKRKLGSFSDPLYFKTQLLLELLTGAIYAIHFGILESIPALESYWHITNSISRYAMYSTMVIAPLCFIFYTFIYRKFWSPVEQRDKDLVKHILNHQKLRALLWDFANIEFSSENLHCWKDVQVIKKAKHGKRLELSKKFYRTYLNGFRAPLEVNLPKKIGELVWEMNANEKFEMRVYTKIDRKIRENISDTVTRFIISKEYAKYKAKMLAIEKIKSTIH